MKTDRRKYVEYASEEWRQRARHYCDVNGRSQWREQGAYNVSTTLPYVRAVGTEWRSNKVAGHIDIWTSVPISIGTRYTIQKFRKMSQTNNACWRDYQWLPVDLQEAIRGNDSIAGKLV